MVLKVKEKTVQLKDWLNTVNVKNFNPSEGVDIVYKQVTKDDVKNKECYATLFAESKDLIYKDLDRLPIVSDRVRKSKIDEINSIPKCRGFQNNIKRF